MRIKQWAVLSAILSCFATMQTSQAEGGEKNSPWSVDTTFSVFSDYMFRGQNLYDGTSIQPSTEVGYDTGAGVVSGGLWMHLSGEGNSSNDPESFTELDGTLRYTYEAESFSLSVGNFWYTYPRDSDGISSTKEVFASIGLNLPLNPVFSVFHDYDELDYQSYEVGLSHTFEKIASSEASLTPFVAFGFSSNSEKVYAENGLEHVTVGSSLEIPVGALTFAPVLNYTFKVDDTTVNELWFGTALSYSF